MPRTAPPPRRTVPASGNPEPVLRTGLAAALYFGLALVYFLPALLPGQHIFGTDYLNAGYFFYDFISERTAAGKLPGWVPYIFGGVPLFSNPGSTYYPVRWVADLLGPTRIFFPLLFWFQFGFAGWGMYLLAREIGCRGWVAFLAGLAFQWTGITTSWVYAGHDGRIIVATLAPLLLFFLHRGIRTARLPPFVGAAATVAFVLLSFQIQNAYYLLLGAFLWSLFLLVHFGVHRQPRLLAKTVALGGGAVLFGFLTASVNFLPFQDYVSESPRGMTGGRGYEYSTSYSMPWRGLLGIAVPEQVGATIQNERGEYVFPVYRGENGFQLHTEYLGALAVVLFALGVWYARRDRYWLFFAALGLFALTLSLGGNTPLYRLYYEVLPGLKRFRAPSLAFYIASLSLTCMAAVTLEALAGQRAANAGAQRDRVPLWIGAGLVAGVLAGAAVLGLPSAPMAEGTIGLSPAQGWFRFGVFAAGAAAAIGFWWKGSLASRAVFLLLAILTTVDLWTIGKRFFQTVPAPEEMFVADEITAFLLQQPGPFRFWPLPGQSAWPLGIDEPMIHNLENAGGEHGNQLQRYNEFAGAGAETYVDFHNFLRDPRFLAAANVRFLVASVDLQVPWLRQVFRGQRAAVYENLLALPRAFFVENVREVAAPDATLPALQDSTWNPRQTAIVETPRSLGLPVGPLRAEARITAYDPDRIVVQTDSDRRALLVLSDNMYKGWHATIDGREAPIYRTNHTFRGVVVPEGSHRVEFTFRPVALHTGFWIYLGCLGALVAYGLFLLYRQLRSNDPVAHAAG